MPNDWPSGMLIVFFGCVPTVSLMPNDWPSGMGNLGCSSPKLDVGATWVNVSSAKVKKVKMLNLKCLNIRSGSSIRTE